MTANQFSSQTRRALLAYFSTMAASSLSGCASWFGIAAVCPDSPEVSYPGGPLTIDTHCHVFNGTDLQIKDFLSKVAVKQGGALGVGANILASVLQELAWTAAPDGKAELEELKTVAQAVRSCTPADTTARIASLRQAAYSTGRQQLQAALRLAQEFRPQLDAFTLGSAPFDLGAGASARLDSVRAIETLPEEVETYRASRSSLQLNEFSAGGRSVPGLIDFVLQNFQYRYVSVHDYLRTYNAPGARVVDLMLPSMVDYDWWLSKGAKTPTSLAQQVDVMEQISILTRGRVHAFVAYDPLRQVASDLGFGTGDPFAVVKNAVEAQGCVGVKLYPPMGFAPYGNKEVQRTKGAHFWACPWLPYWTDRPDLGVLLDAAMQRLLHWCEDNQVPVMAHTNLSNGVAKDFEALAGSQYWKAALVEVPKLRVNFGHFGDTSLVEDGRDGITRARDFAILMTDRASAKSGAFAYADAGYFVEVMNRQPELLDDLRLLYDETASKLDAALANRFLYGTDWEMTLTEGRIDTYMSQFVALFDSLERRPALLTRGLSNLSSRFFGLNAVSFLGLKKGDRARGRLDSFYKANAVATPDWMTKVDAL